MDFFKLNRISFNCEWFQEEAMVIRPFLVNYFPAERSMEIYDQKNKKTFLRKTRIDELKQEDFYVGSKLNVFGRQIEIIEYADESTKRALGKSRQRVFVLIKSNMIPKIGIILNAFIGDGFSVTNGLMAQFNEQSAKYLFGEKIRGNTEITNLVNQMVSEPVVGFEMFADNGIEKLKACTENSSSALIKNQVQHKLQSLFDDENIRNSIYFPKTEEEANSELNLFFTPEISSLNTAVLQKSVLGIIKPHAIKEGRTGEIINDILGNGFKLTALKMMVMERVNCEEFLEIYRGVSQEYIQMVAHLASGSCLAFELQSTDERKNIHKSFREFCGPKDPEIAKQLRPNTLRAKYGRNKVLNTIHCTDLPEDTILELEYFFKILE